MKLFTHTILTVCFLFTSQLSFAQELLTEVPSTKEQFIASEPKVLATIDWLENTPINRETEKRKLLNTQLIAWITNSPTVTVELNAGILDFTNKTPELLVIFLGGWTRYSLQNNYSKDTVAGSLAGIRSAMRIYKTGLLAKNKELQKLIELEEKGGLEDWVKKKLNK
jgi:hypothetical protein